MYTCNIKIHYTENDFQSMKNMQHEQTVNIWQNRPTFGEKIADIRQFNQN